MVLQIANITKDTPELFHLLEEAYNDIFVDAFPDEKARESLDKLMRAAKGGFDKVDPVINILGENLEDPESYVIKGISIGYYYKRENVGLLAYNAIDPEHQECGLGKLMVESRIQSMQAFARAQGKELAGVFVECNDPLKVPASMDSMDPAKRIAIFEKWGARQIPIDYVQPPLEPGGYYDDNLVLLNYPIGGKYADKDCIESYLRGIYRDYRTEQIEADGQKITRVIRADDDYYFQQMKTQLDKTMLKDATAPAVPGYKKGVPKFNFFKPS